MLSYDVPEILFVKCANVLFTFHNLKLSANNFSTTVLDVRMDERIRPERCRLWGTRVHDLGHKRFLFYPCLEYGGKKRSWLWATCNLPGREISAIYVSDVEANLQAAYDSGNCNTVDIDIVKQMLVEGHSQVYDIIVRFRLDGHVFEILQISSVVLFNCYCYVSSMRIARWKKHH